MGQAPEHVRALLREHTTTHQCNELHYLKKLPGSTAVSEKYPMIVFLNGAGERGPADGSELDRACMHGVLKVAMAGPSGPGLPAGILDGFLIANPQLCAHPRPFPACVLRTILCCCCSHVEAEGGWADHVHSMKAMIDEIVAEHPVDTSRIYLT